jgi:hypothetical protein
VNANRPTGDIVIELSRYVFETLREDEECAFCRDRKDDGELTGILLVAPVSERPVPGILERLEHEYSLPHCGPPSHIVGTATLISGCPAITAKHVLEELRKNANFKPETYD